MELILIVLDRQASLQFALLIFCNEILPEKNVNEAKLAYALIIDLFPLYIELNIDEQYRKHQMNLGQMQS